MSPVLPGPKPPWLRRTMCLDQTAKPVDDLIKQLALHTVCSEAACPNCQECFASKRATFLLLGNVCTRACRYCNVTKGEPGALDMDEPQKVAAAALKLGLKHIVLTSVTRDDLPDQGSGIYCKTIRALRQENPEITIETLIPDFSASNCVDLWTLKPEVLNHNIETVPSLFPIVRPRASFKRSLELLSRSAAAGLLTKSGFMVGLGESVEEVKSLIKQLAEVGVQIVTIGQYLPPSSKHYPVARYVEPVEYEEWAEWGRANGIKYIFAGPLVRSSYLAEDVFAEFVNGRSSRSN